MKGLADPESHNLDRLVAGVVDLHTLPIIILEADRLMREGLVPHRHHLAVRLDDLEAAHTVTQGQVELKGKEGEYVLYSVTQ